MSALSYSDLVSLAQGAGFSGANAYVAAAIAMAESSGQSSVIGDLNITPGGSVGLWQINLQAHPEYSASDLMDPQSNADAAFAVYQAAGNSFAPWTTFNNGSYLSFLSGGAQDDGSGALGVDSGQVNYSGLILAGLAAAGIALYVLE